MRHLATILLLSCFVVVAGACSSSTQTSDNSENESGDSKETTAQQDTEAILGVENVREAVVYIEARGGVVDQFREFGQEGAFTGSGFIIDGDEGLIVTNNHVVTGAGYLEVYLDGQDEPVGAQVLGASECSDLALLKVDEEDLPYLEWREEEIEAGMNVRAAGYPGGDISPGEKPDYTITQGTVNTLDAEGETPIFSLSSIIEHDALIRGGNSGGPLVDEEGRIVGVNVASSLDPETGTPTGQQFAIGQDQALELVDQLKEGDVEGIGINGVVYTDEAYSGIDVNSVKTGSPADRVGIKGLEVDSDTGNATQYTITEIEDSRLGENGTMEVYCDIVRDRAPESPLRVTVQRYRISESGSLELDATLEGTLNGGEDGKLEEVS